MFFRRLEAVKCDHDSFLNSIETCISPLFLEREQCFPRFGATLSSSILRKLTWGQFLIVTRAEMFPLTRNMCLTYSPFFTLYVNDIALI